MGPAWQHDHGRPVVVRKEGTFRGLKMLDGGQNRSQRSLDAESLGLLTQVLGHALEPIIVVLLGLTQQVSLSAQRRARESWASKSDATSATNESASDP